MRSLLMCSVAMAILLLASVCGKTRAVPAPEREKVAPVESSHGVSRPLDLGTGILDKFNLKLLKGTGGTNLGIDGPSNLRLQLNKATPIGLLSRVFGSSSSQPQRA